MDDLITVIDQTYQADEIGQQVPLQTTRQIWAHIQTASGTEFMDGGRIGIKPALVATTPIVNYQGEKNVQIGEQMYRVFRVYIKENSDLIELHLEEQTGIL